MKRWTQKGRDENPDVRISKTLAYLLRHGAQNEGLKIDKAGYVRVDDILERIFFKSKRITADRIINIVETNERNRYELKRETDSTGKPVVYIRATEGHSLKVIENISSVCKF